MPLSPNPRRSGSLTDVKTKISNEPWQNYFTVQDTIGRGKFAVVKKCIEISSGKLFAAKCIRKRRHCRDCTPDIFHEIAVLEISSNHPHLIDLYRVFETPSEVILILEYAAGGEIFDHCVGVKDHFSEATTRRLLLQILEAVNFLHRHNIVHLDLKPQNILLTAEGEKGDIKLVDFGLSKLLTHEIEIREILGTPDYVAPEVLNFEPISILSDIWSLGVVCYVMLTGVSPFLGDTKNETLMNVTTGAIDFPPDLFATKDTACRDFISKMLKREPQDRISAQQCLNHPWITGVVTPLDNILPTEENHKDGSDEPTENDVFSNSPSHVKSTELSKSKTDSKSDSDRPPESRTISRKDVDLNGNLLSNSTGLSQCVSPTTDKQFFPANDDKENSDNLKNKEISSKPATIPTTEANLTKTSCVANSTQQNIVKPDMFPISPKPSTKRRKCEFLHASSTAVHVARAVFTSTAAAPNHSYA